VLDSSEQRTLPLEGVRAIELGTLIAGPFCTRLLADFGAEVIKVESPGTGDPMREWGAVLHEGLSLVWPYFGRNKKSVTLDLRLSEGQELARTLISRADVVVENFRPGTMDKWGLGYQQLRLLNPRIVLVHVSGYGQTGPYRDRAGFGAAAGAMGGMRYLTGYPDRPPVRVGLSIEDSIAALYAVIGALLALYHRDTHASTGQEVDVSLLESIVSLTEGSVTEYAVEGLVREREGTTLPGVAPSNVYETRDGSWLVIAANATGPFRRLCAAIGVAELGDDPRYQTNNGRLRNRDALDRIISEWVSTRSKADVLRILDESGVPCAPINTAADLVADPHLRDREAIVYSSDPRLGRIPMPGVVPKLSGTAGRIAWTGPSLGEHNDEVYGGILGLSATQLDDLRRRRVI
jgi:succinyl-CoA---D-citramalate CoA-transferase